MGQVSTRTKAILKKGLADKRAGTEVNTLFSTGGSQAMADANQTLTSGLENGMIVSTTGAITANRTLTVPADAVGYGFWLDNQCSGAFSVVVSTGSGTTVTVGNAKRAYLWVDSRGVTRFSADA